jgi:hypothetical protein
MSTTSIKHLHNASNHAWILISTSQKKVGFSVGFFMSFMDDFETLFIVKIEKKNCRNVFAMKDLMKYFADNFNLHTLKKNKNERQVKGNKKHC